MSLGVGRDCLFPNYVKVPIFPGSDQHTYLRVRCGHCYNCKLYKTDLWTNRLACESRYHKDICFVTVTYSEKEVPGTLWEKNIPCLIPEYDFVMTLDRDSVKKYVKRIRKQIGDRYKIKFYATGEYGPLHQRPHYHFIFFGVPKEDYLIFQKCWKFGHVDVQEFHPETCAYIAGYVQKKLYGDLRDPRRQVEFLNCSQHLGEQWFLDRINQFDDEHCYLVINGYRHPLPKVWRNILVENGLVKKQSVLNVCQQQLSEYKKLNSHCDSQGISLSEYFRSRVASAKLMIDKKNVSRLKESFENETC